MGRRFLLLVLPALAACAPRAATRPPAGAPMLVAVPVTGLGYHNETSVAVDPASPSRVIASYQIPATVAWSADGGATWAPEALPQTDKWQLAGDPLVLFDDDGHAYALYIAFDRPEDYDTLGKAAHRNGIWLNRSDDGGRTWRPEATPVFQQPEQPGIPFEDKPMAAVDRSSDRSRRGNLYVAWTEFQRWRTRILFSRSTDGGRSFSAPLEISDRAGSPKDSVGADEGTDVAVGPDGTVYVVWSDSTGIVLDRSTDRGQHFGADVRVARTPDIVFGIPSVARCNGYPSIEADPGSGRLYVSWVDKRSGAAAVYLATSDDGGATWSPPRTVSEAAPGDTRDRFFSWMSRDPKSGALVFGYYLAEQRGEMVYMLAWSADGGASFRHRQWSRGSFHPRGEFLGDYTGVDAFDGVAYGAWTEAAPTDTAGGVHNVSRATRVVVGRAALR